MATKLDAKWFTRKSGGSKSDGKDLARAFARAHSEGFTYEWREEPEYDTDRSGIEHDFPLWQCAMHDSGGKVVASLGGIDLVDNGPYSDPYARLVEAELAFEAGL